MATLLPWLLFGLVAAAWSLTSAVWVRRTRRLAAQAILAERQARSTLEAFDTLQERHRIDDAILQRLPDPLIVLGPDRLVRRANDAARLAFGANMPALLRHPGFRAALDSVAAGPHQPAELDVPVPVARELHATVFAPLAGVAAGSALVAILSDRTRDRAVERMREDFVANASHELRTPLTSLIGFIETLRGPAADDPDAQARFLAIMAEQAQRMNRLIDDLLSLSRIELTEHQPPSGTVSLPNIVGRMADAFGPLLASRRIRLGLDLAPGLPDVPGDEDQLEQVLQNLLDNAVKYGREGGTIRVRAQPATPTPPWKPQPGVLLAVADDGQGIARQHIPRLTERFYRVDTHRSRAVGGTGLGLAIVKHIVNRHRGQLAIDSAEGAGTTVSIWLPC